MKVTVAIARVVLTALAAMVAQSAHAVPSYARQMGVSCNVCHTAFPQLTAFGREFKLEGYTTTTTPSVSDKDTQDKDFLSLSSLPPLSIMFQTGYTNTARTQPDTQNDDVAFPQEASLFFAGRLAPKFGAFVQATYDGAEDHFGIDNVEFRFASKATMSGKTLKYGMTLNNNPTIEDLWNTTPVWGFPWASSGSAPTPAASALIQENLGQTVAGLGSYAMWNDAFYGALTFYRSAQLGTPAPSIDSEATISGVAPYWRFAWQHQSGPSSFEIGTYGMQANLFPSGVSGDTDEYTDIAGDFQYERTFGTGMLTLHGTYISEDRKLHASFAAGDATQSSNSLDTWRLDAGYIQGHWQAVGGYFNISGDSDPLLYGGDPVSGSANGSPDSSGYLLQGSYFPWRNIELQAQYTAYSKFNGASSNYDGNGRDASDNDTLYLLAWFMW
jgi:hypothetical protein